MNRIISVQMRWAQVTAAGTIYYSPGYGITSHAYSQCPVLFTTDGTTATHVWTGDAMTTIGCLFYTTITSKVYMLTYGRSFGNDVVSVYSWSEGGTPTLLATFTSIYKPIQACEFGGVIYLWCNEPDNSNPAVMTLNLSTGALTSVLSWASNAGSSYAYGGIGSDGTTIFASDGGDVYASTDGSSWSPVYTWDTNYFPWLGAFASSGSAGKVYCGCSNGSSAEEGLLPGVYEVTTSGLTLVTARAAKGTYIAGLVHRQSGGVQSGLVGLTEVDAGNTQPIYRYDSGSWTALDSAYTRVGLPHPVTSAGGSVYELVATGPYVLPDWDHWAVHLLKDGTEIYLHDWMGPIDASAMTVCSTGLKCHEV